MSCCGVEISVCETMQPAKFVWNFHGPLVEKPLKSVDLQLWCPPFLDDTRFLSREEWVLLQFADP